MNGEKENLNYIMIMSGSESARVRVSDVVLIERNRRKLRIITDYRIYDFYGKMEAIEPMLDERFFPCLKGCYINFERVVRMTEQSIFFDNGMVYSLGRENFLRTKHQFKEYLKKVMKNACNFNRNDI